MKYKLPELDLHGIYHVEVESLVNKFLEDNQDNLPVLIITGNSDKMKEAADALKLTAQNLKEIGNYTFKISKGAKAIILGEGYDPKFGARPLKRTLERMVI